MPSLTFRRRKDYVPTGTHLPFISGDTIDKRRGRIELGAGRECAAVVFAVADDGLRAAAGDAGLRRAGGARGLYAPRSGRTPPVDLRCRVQRGPDSRPTDARPARGAA